MANPEHLAKLKEGVEAWNAWRKANPEIVPDLSEAELVEENLSEADLRGANLRQTAIPLADLTEANLAAADLRWATFVRTHFTGADLTEANLTGADLTEANLGEAGLHEANLSGADFTGAFIGYTIFGDNDLSYVKGLETVKHEGPSIIGIDTIYRSHGNIPLAFLRGAGVPENFIEYMGSLTGKALEFYSCFISYSSKDQEFAERLHADLQNKSVRCWFAPHDMRGGKKTYEQIGGAIRTYERLLLILSPNSMNSEWVKTEISRARKREVTENRQVLFPIRLVSIEDIRQWTCFDALIGKDSAREILEFHIHDFSDWENRKSYAEGLKNLLRDLKTEGSKAA